MCLVCGTDEHGQVGPDPVNVARDPQDALWVPEGHHDGAGVPRTLGRPWAACLLRPSRVFHYGRALRVVFAGGTRTEREQPVMVSGPAWPTPLSAAPSL
jgi:hypothetical protein